MSFSSRLARLIRPVVGLAAQAQAQQTVHDDRTADGRASVRLDGTTSVHGGRNAIRVTVAAGSYGAPEVRTGLPPAPDGSAFRPYAGCQERAAVDQDADRVKPSTAVDPDASFAPAVRRLREQGRLKPGHAPQTRATERGSETGGKSPQGTLTGDLIASYAPRAFILADAAGVRAVRWFRSRDGVDGPVGLTAEDGAGREQRRAVQTLTRRRGADTLVGRIAGGGRPRPGLQALLSRGPGGFRAVAWDTGGESPVGGGGKRDAPPADVAALPATP